MEDDAHKVFDKMSKLKQNDKNDGLEEMVLSIVRLPWVLSCGSEITDELLMLIFDPGGYSSLQMGCVLFDFKHCYIPFQTLYVLDILLETHTLLEYSSKKQDNCLPPCSHSKSKLRDVINWYAATENHHGEKFDNRSAYTSLIETGVKVVGLIVNEVELWVGKVLILVFDPGGSSWFFNGCGCAPFESNGDKKIFDKFTETNVGSDEELLRVIPFTSYASCHSNHLLLITNGSLNMEIKNWVFTINAGWMLPSDSGPWIYRQVLQLKKLVRLLLEEMLYDRAKALFQALLSSILAFGTEMVRQHAKLQIQELKDMKGAPIVISIVHFSEKIWVTKFCSNKEGSSAGKEMEDFGLNIMNIGLDMSRPKKIELALLLSDYKHFAQYMNSNDYDGVSVAKLENFVWDLGRSVISFYILEDKDVFERVGKDLVLMHNTLEMTGLIMILGCLSGQPFWNPDLDAWFASCCISDGLEDTVGAVDDIGLIPNALVFSTAELEHYIWDLGSFVSVLQLSCEDLGGDFHLTTLRTRWLLRGRLCHDIALYYNFYMYFRIYGFGGL